MNDNDGSVKSIRENNADGDQKAYSGRRWMIVFSAFVINIIVDGCLFSFGVIYVQFLEEFKETRSNTAWIGSMLDSAPMLFGPVASMITKRIGFRKATIFGGLIGFSGFIASTFVNSIEALCLTFGLIAGFGISIPYLNSIVVVTAYFEKKRTIATGFSQSGAGLGTLIFAPLYEFLIEQYGWRGALTIISGILLQTIPCGAIFRNVNAFVEIEDIKDEIIIEKTLENNIVIEKENPESTDVTDKFIENSSTRNSRSDTEIQEGVSISRKIYNTILRKFSMLKDINFLLFTCSLFIVYFWYDLPYNFTVDRMQGFGFSTKKGSYIVAVIGASHIVGNILFGFLGSRNEKFRFYLYCGSLCIWGVNICAIPSFRDYIPNMILAGTFGLISACQEAIHAVIIIDILGEDKITDAYGLLMFFEGIANLTGPPFAGWLYDISGSYDNTYISGGSCICFAGIMVLVTRICVTKTKNANLAENDI
ncbi:monocarboxylate transporter 12-like [Mytilus californianus]|uniref:monocarboxylate transporter 12-like n=1 Tax=Mytilus californianus TaxID=6549 RepID=UPI0022487567|nr:monocarboxylate transporter 12-like [Mytilus californianus]